MATTYSTAQLQQYAASFAEEFGIPVQLFLAQITQESGWNPNALSGAGAQGIAQFMPGTAAGMGLSNPWDPVASLQAAAELDHSLFQKYGSWPYALAGYNAGSGAIAPGSSPSSWPAETQAYVKSIMAAAGNSVSSIPSTVSADFSSASAAVQQHTAATNPTPDSAIKAVLILAVVAVVVGLAGAL